METRKYDGVIQRDRNLALQNQVSVTPTVFVLSSDPARTGTKFDGSPSFEDVSKAIDELLGAPEPTPIPSPTPRPTATPEPIAPGRTWNTLGSPDAPVTLEDFSDFQ